MPELTPSFPDFSLTKVHLQPAQCQLMEARRQAAEQVVGRFYKY